jgi:single-strand DNA-binding protein
MANFNKVIIAGNLTKDVELKHTPKGTAVAKLGIAINRSWTGDDGQKREDVTFVDVDAFGKQAETLAKYIKKGRSILIEGRLKLDQWDDKQTGQKKSRLGVLLESFSFLDSKQVESQQPRPTSAAAQQPPAQEPPMDDVPFNWAARATA